MRIVVRIGGSVVASPINPRLIREYADLLVDLNGKGHDIVAVVGGGKLAREFIAATRDVGLDQEAQDKIAILVSRLFAQLLLLKLDKAGCEGVVTDLDELSKVLSAKRIAVMGGLKPGITTDAVAALVAEKIKADMLIKGTDQDGVYDKDPKKHSDALKLDHMFLDDLSEVFEQSTHKAGMHQIIDPVAIEVLKRYRLKLVIVNGFQPANIAAAIKGENIGTVIE